jgi:hypothetical protein
MKMERAEAVRRQDLRRSLQNPHPESAELSEAHFAEWMQGLPEEDAEALVDGSAGQAIQWIPNEGWVEDRP